MPIFRTPPLSLSLRADEYVPMEPTDRAWTPREAHLVALFDQASTNAAQLRALEATAAAADQLIAELGTADVGEAVARIRQLKRAAICSYVERHLDARIAALQATEPALDYSAALLAAEAALAQDYQARDRAA